MVTWSEVPVPRQNLVEDLAAQIGAAIRGGEYRPGDCLPPIVEIARRCRVSPATARAALARLEALGLVLARQGSGVYVR